MEPDERRWMLCKDLMIGQLERWSDGEYVSAHPHILMKAVTSALNELPTASDDEVIHRAYLKVLGERLRLTMIQVNEFMEQLPEVSLLPESLGLVKTDMTPDEIERCLSELDPQMSKPWLQPPRSS